MKKISLILIALSVVLSARATDPSTDPDTDTDIVKPTKCLFSSYLSRRWSSTGTTQVFELCSEMNTERRVAGVCMFDRVWKRGNWDPSKKDRNRFVATRICDKGVEYSRVTQDSLPYGPRFFNPTEVKIEGAYSVSQIKKDNPRLQDNVPATCFTQHDPTTLGSAAGLPCTSDMLSANNCELKDLNLPPTRRGRGVRGHWWVHYKNPHARLQFTICVGGVTLVKVTDQDPLYAKIPGIKKKDEHDEVRFCIRPVGRYNQLTEVLCDPNTNGHHPCQYEPNTKWEQRMPVRKKAPIWVDCNEMIVEKPRTYATTPESEQ